MTLKNDHWENVITILAIAVIADHRVRDPEIIEFSHEAQRLNSKYFPDRILTRTTLKAWFNQNRDDIDEALKSQGIEPYLSSYATVITDSDLCLQILRSVFAICICDYEIMDEEAEVLQVLSKLWGLRPPIAQPEMFSR